MREDKFRGKSLSPGRDMFLLNGGGSGELILCRQIHHGTNSVSSQRDARPTSSKGALVIHLAGFQLALAFLLLSPPSWPSPTQSFCHQDRAPGGQCQFQRVSSVVSSVPSAAGFAVPESAPAFLPRGGGACNSSSHPFLFITPGVLLSHRRDLCT